MRDDDGAGPSCLGPVGSLVGSAAGAGGSCVGVSYSGSLPTSLFCYTPLFFVIA